MTTYIPSIIQYRESIPHSQSNINEALLKNIKEKIGNKCHKNGFIKKDTISIIERSMGKINSSHFNGKIAFDIKLSVDICNPVQGDIIECVVKGKNKMGILAENNPMTIALSKLHHQDTKVFDEINIGDTIKVKVICSQYEFKDTMIQVIAEFVSKV